MRFLIGFMGWPIDFRDDFQRLSILRLADVWYFQGGQLYSLGSGEIGRGVSHCLYFRPVFRATLSAECVVFNAGKNRSLSTLFECIG